MGINSKLAITANDQEVEVVAIRKQIEYAKGKLRQYTLLKLQNLVDKRDALKPNLPVVAEFITQIKETPEQIKPVLKLLVDLAVGEKFPTIQNPIEYYRGFYILIGGNYNYNPTTNRIEINSDFNSDKFIDLRNVVLELNSLVKMINRELFKGEKNKINNEYNNLSASIPSVESIQQDLPIVVKIITANVVNTPYLNRAIFRLLAVLAVKDYRQNRKLQLDDEKLGDFYQFIENNYNYNPKINQIETKNNATAMTGLDKGDLDELNGICSEINQLVVGINKEGTRLVSKH